MGKRKMAARGVPHRLQADFLWARDPWSRRGPREEQRWRGRGSRPNSVNEQMCVSSLTLSLVPSLGLHTKWKELQTLNPFLPFLHCTCLTWPCLDMNRPLYSELSSPLGQARQTSRPLVVWYLNWTTVSSFKTFRKGNLKPCTESLVGVCLLEDNLLWKFGNLLWEFICHTNLFIFWSFWGSMVE